MTDTIIEDDDPAPAITTDNCRHPDVVVQLTGADGGTGAILSRVCMALEDEGVDAREVSEYRTNALFAGDYNAFLRYTMEWVTVK